MFCIIKSYRDFIVLNSLYFHAEAKLLYYKDSCDNIF